MGELAKARKQLKGDGRRLGSGSVSVARCSHMCLTAADGVSVNVLIS